MAKAKTTKAPKAPKVDTVQEPIIHEGHDARNGLVTATATAVTHHRKNGLVIPVSSEAEAKEIFEACIADSQTF